MKNLKLVILFVATLSIATLGAKAISSHSAGMDQIQIDVTSQDANGLTTRDFNRGFLRSLKAYILQETERKMSQSGRSANPEESNHISSEAVYAEGDKKLAVIRLQTRSWNTVAIVGFVNEKMTRVVCTLAL